MASSLSPEHRARLTAIVQKMYENGETDDYIQNAVNLYKAKYSGAPAAPKVAGGYLEGPSKYQENFGGDPLNSVNAIPGVPYKIPLGSAIDAFPTAGGAVFGSIGGFPGATVGGGSMDMLRRSLRGMPIDLKASGVEGLKQGAAQIVGSGLRAGTALVGPAARLAERVAANPIARGAAKLLPFGGYATHGMSGAVAGVALPLAGKAAVRVAIDPRTELALREFAQYSPAAARHLWNQLNKQE